ncbi:HTH-type transcriptional regulator UlaR [Reinekea thalattae]|uniref:HTH-type transcriptional regulator UlaR n=1 Tax=Reinekea thalattae TaxID=2593301 RepID=A0A5C8ZAR4_9GAMM|nr:HTH-type transcriptional regulator UlaR [Reinekea thalattae]TXR54271.1 HTH-type transcriptional regulator UlaR [Reinekea thalattae]
MNPRSRQQSLLSFLEEHSIVTVQQIVEHLACSPATVRRDIVELDQQGKLKKIRNGAEKILSPSTSKAPGFKHFYPNISDFSHYDESERIAQCAVGLCQGKDSIFIGEGPTAFLMGKYLVNTNIHVYSNYLPLITYLISEDFPHLVVLGGQYIKNQNLLMTPEKQMNYQGRYLFVTGDGLTEAGLTKSALLSFMQEKKMLDYADKVIALVDSDKVGVFGGISMFGLDEIDVVVTGQGADAQMLQLLREKNVAVHLV